jgi:thioredoxin reductase (NADPH)
MQKRVLENPKIEVLFDTATDEILGEHAVEAVRVKNLVTHETREIPVLGFFVAIGHTPNTAIFADYIQRDDHGYILTEKGSTRTNIPGVFACGDAQDNVYRQAITAAGTGCMAALEAERWLAHHGLGESPVLETAEAPVRAGGE